MDSIDNVMVNMLTSSMVYGILDASMFTITLSIMIVGSSPGRVKPMTIILVFDASPLST
jgi:hypothetical protein